MIGWFLATGRLFLLGVALLFVAPVCILFKTYRRDYVPAVFFHRLLCFIFCIKVRVNGEVFNFKGNDRTLFVSNHLSFLDIPVLGSYLQARFVAKKEVAGWPVFGLLSKFQDTVYIERKPEAVERSARDIDQALNDTGAVIIFPEGTSWTAKEILPFKRRILSRLNFDVIQPVLIMPARSSDMEIYPWYGDMEFLPNLVAIARRRSTCVDVLFLPPIFAGDIAPELIAEKAHKVISDAHAQKLIAMEGLAS